MKQDKSTKEFSINFNLNFVVSRRLLGRTKSQIKNLPKKPVKIEELIHSRYQDENYYSCINGDNSEIILHQGSGIFINLIFYRIKDITES